MTGLWVVGLDLATASGVARTHDRFGEPRLAVDTIDASGLPLHRKVDLIQSGVMTRCGWDPGGWGDRRKPDLAVVEGSFSAGNAADYVLHAIRANVLQWLHRHGIPYAEVTPATLKVFATGSGSTKGENKVTKDKVIAAVVATYGSQLHINARDDNACDAVALMAMGRAWHGQPLADVPQSHRRALDSVTWPDLTGGAK